MVKSASLDDRRKTWPHDAGAVVLAHTLDGSVLYTGGFDGFVRVHNPDPESSEEPKFIEEHDQTITSLDCSFDELVTACEDGTVKLFDHDSLQFRCLITRSNIGMAIRDVKLNRKAHSVAVASDELTIKIIDMRDITKIQILKGHTKPLRSVSWNPDGTILTSCDSDGCLRVWNLTISEEPLCVKVIEDLLPAQPPESNIRVEAIWHPSGRVFAVPTRANEIALISNDSFVKIHTFFSPEAHSSLISAFAWSPNGNYLVSAGSLDRKVVVWDNVTKNPIICTTAPAMVTSIAFRPGPGSNSIAFGTVEGHLQQWDNLIPDDIAHPVDGPRRAFNKEKEVSKENDITINRPEADDVMDELGDMDWLDDDDDDNEGAEYKKALELDLAEEGDVVEDEDEETRTYADTGQGISSKGASGHSLSINAQPSFQPGSTPVRERRKYMAFNMLGFIHAVEREDSHQVITIEYHDRLSNNGYHWNDNNNCTIACLGDRGSAYAAPSRDGQPSKLLFKPAKSSANEWQYEFPPEEDIVNIAMSGIASKSSTSEQDEHDVLNVTLEGSGVIVAATDKGLIRFFTVSGLQKYVCYASGQVVSLAASSDIVFIVTRGPTGGIDGYQNLEYTLIDSDSFEIIQHGAVPLVKGETLRWIGFSQSQIPAIFSSKGLLSLLDRARRPRQGRWVPMLDTVDHARAENKDEKYWAIGVTRTQLVCLALEPGMKYPFFPTPITQEIDLKMPMLNMNNQESQLEESYVRQTVIARHERDGLPDPCDDNDKKQEVEAAEIEIDKCLLKAIQTACRSDKLDQALDLTRSLIQSRSVEAAGKIAGFFNHFGLQSHIETIAGIRSNKSNDDLSKRDAKYSHLADDRIMVDSVPSATSRRGVGSSSRDLFSAPFDDSLPSNGLMRTEKHLVSSGLPAAKRPENDNETFDESIDFSMDDLSLPGPIGANDDATGPVSQAEESLGVSKRPFNPFSKSRLPAQVPAPSRNPFRSDVEKAKRPNLKKSDSFFDRVDKSNVGDSKGKSSKASSRSISRQSTLLSNSEPQSKKRKSMEPSMGSAENTLQNDDNMLAQDQEVEMEREVTPTNEEETQPEVQGSPEWFDENGDLLEGEDDEQEDESDNNTNDGGGTLLESGNKKAKMTPQDDRHSSSKLDQFRNPAVAA